jgi:hypothetical protein
MILLAKTRLQRNKVSSTQPLPPYYNNTENPAISLQSHVLRLHNILIGKSQSELKSTSTSSSSTTTPSQSNSTKIADIMIDDINTIAQLIKLSIRELPESLITNIAYVKLKRSLELCPGLSSTPKTQLEKKSHNDWGNIALGIINTMPIENKATLLHLFNFLSEICTNTAVNSMDVYNLAVIFSPTLINIDESDPINAMNEIKLSRSIINGLLLKVYNDKYGEENNIINKNVNEEDDLISFDNYKNDLISFDDLPPKPPITSIDSYFCQDSDDEDESINSFQPTITIGNNNIISPDVLDNKDLMNQFSSSLGLSEEKLADLSKRCVNVRQSTRITSSDKVVKSSNLPNLEEANELNNNSNSI